MKTEKQIIRTIDNFSRYLFLAMLILIPVLITFNIIRL